MGSGDVIVVGCGLLVRFVVGALVISVVGAICEVGLGDVIVVGCGSPVIPVTGLSAGSEVVGSTIVGVGMQGEVVGSTGCVGWGVIEGLFPMS